MLKKVSLIAVVLILGLAATLGGWVYLQLHQTLALEEPKVLEVAKGRSYISLLQQLEQEGIIQHSLAIRAWLRLTGKQGLIHAGEYQLTPSLSLATLYQQLQTGAVITYKLTLVEGTTFKDLRATLAAAPKLIPTTATWTEAAIMQELGWPDQPAEGWFFPDTYTYSKGMQDLDILRLAHTKMRRLLEETWATRAENLPYKSAYEALIMASIIERETGVAYERPDIAGVFVRRLHKGMRLQTDPTVIYGMQDRYTGRITRQDLRTPTPWNTYVINGLPPTPIALPSAEALQASVNPAPGDALFFVAKGDGTHKFSATLSEHNQAVRQYQLQRRADYRSTPPPELNTELQHD